MAVPFIDFSKWTYLPAPLKTLENVTTRNQNFKNLRSGFVGGFYPEQYNKIGLAYRKAKTGWITSEFMVSGFSIENKYFYTPTAFGAIARTQGDDIPAPTPNVDYNAYTPVDPVYYCTVERVGTHYTTAQLSQLVQYNPYFITPTHATRWQVETSPCPYNGVVLGTRAGRTYDIPAQSRRTFPERVLIDDIPDIENWIIVKSFQLFDSKTAGQYPRVGVGGAYVHSANAEYNNVDIFVAPCVPYAGNSYQTVGMTRDNYGQISVKSYGNGIFVYNPAAWFAGQSSNYPLRQIGSFGMSALFDCYSWAGIYAADATGQYTNIISNVDYYKKIINASYPNEMVMLGLFTNPNSSYGFSLETGQMPSKWIVPNAGAEVMIAFKSWEFVEKLSADFGIHVTTDLEMARNTPIEYFPDLGGITPDPTQPPTGFDENPDIVNIPNYPDNTTDIVSRPAPNITPVAIASVYALSVAETKSFMNWLLTDDFTKNLSELFNDKLTAINDLKLLPFDIVAHDNEHTIASDTLTIANVTAPISNYRVQNNYNVWFYGGDYQYTAYWGNFNDYANASYSLYVPYAGIIDLSASDVVNKRLSIWYAVDLNTGNGTALIYSGDVLIKTCGAQLSISVPIISSNVNQQRINETLTALNVGNSIGQGIAGSVLTANPAPLIGSLVGAGMGAAQTAMTNPFKIQRTGTFSSSTSLLLPQTPFLIISRQQIAIPANYNNLAGKPTAFHGKLNAVIGSGFANVKIKKISTTATTDEQNIISQLLDSGVYI